MDKPAKTPQAGPGHRIMGLVLSALLTATIGSATQAQTVGLRFDDGSDTISGTLLAFEEGRFKIDSSIGPVVIPAAGITCIGDACPEGTGPSVDIPVVTLATADQSVSITGGLLEITDTEYVLATSVGEQRIPRDMVTCSGEGCPSPQAETESAADIEDATVQLTNGVVTIEGALLEIEDGILVVEDKIVGVVRLKASDFSCSGALCP